MQTSVLAFATDLQDEGVDNVLDNVQHRAGVQELTLAVAYHQARDIFPHNPVHKIRYLEGGCVFFAADASRYQGLRLQPCRSEIARESDPLAELCAVARERDMRVNAWAVFLHNDKLGFDHPDCATQNAFGDRYLTDLCPSNPDVRAYCAALAEDIARYEVHTIFAESLHFHGLTHGYHHERYFEELGSVGSYLLGLCFCRHCLDAATQAGVDAELVQRSVRDEIEKRLQDELSEDRSSEITRDSLEYIAGGQLVDYLEARTRTVTSLAERVSSNVAGRVTLTFLDISGADTSAPTGEEAAEAILNAAWRNGIDITALGDVCHAIAFTGYEADAEHLRSHIEAYQARLRDPSRLGVLLRPMPPDCESADNLNSKVAVAESCGLERADFYHYGLSRLRALDWIRDSRSEG